MNNIAELLRAFFQSELNKFMLGEVEECRRALIDAVFHDKPIDKSVYIKILSTIYLIFGLDAIAHMTDDELIAYVEKRLVALGEPEMVNELNARMQR